MPLFFVTASFHRLRGSSPVFGKPRASFTLLELLAGIAIIAALSGLAIGMGRRTIQASHIARARAELAVLSAVLEEYHRICGDYPQTADSGRFLQSLIGRRGPRDAAISIRPLIELAKFKTAAGRDAFIDVSATLVDPWGQPYRYAYKTEVPWTNSSYLLYSIGSDASDSAALLPGGFPDSDAIANVDNLYANRP
jgi:general secretion pathway protein G